MCTKGPITMIGCRILQMLEVKILTWNIIETEHSGPCLSSNKMTINSVASWPFIRATHPVHFCYVFAVNTWHFTTKSEVLTDHRNPASCTFAKFRYSKFFFFKYMYSIHLNFIGKGEALHGCLPCNLNKNTSVHVPPRPIWPLSGRWPNQPLQFFMLNIKAWLNLVSEAVARRGGAQSKP